LCSLKYINIIKKEQTSRSRRATSGTASTVHSKLHLVAELEILFLRPEEPGHVVTQGGDIDDRLKTLLDALRMPKNPSEPPPGDAPTDGENPFFCLLEDDNLVTRVALTTDRLLEQSPDPNEVLLVMQVNVRAVRAILGNERIRF
jgi:hypothetical protein